MSFVDALTNLNDRQRRQLILYYVDLAEVEKVTVHRQADKLFHRLRARANGQDTGEFQYALLLLAIQQYRNQAESGLTERRNTTPQQIAELRRRRIARVIQARADRRAPLAAAIERYSNDIGDMRAAGLSWPEIAHYLVIHHTRAFVRPGRQRASLDARYLARTWAALSKKSQPVDL